MPTSLLLVSTCYLLYGFHNQINCYCAPLIISHPDCVLRLLATSNPYCNLARSDKLIISSYITVAQSLNFFFISFILACFTHKGSCQYASQGYWKDLYVMMGTIIAFMCVTLNVLWVTALAT